jgi:phage/plasmid-associated DNA primase
LREKVVDDDNNNTKKNNKGKSVNQDDPLHIKIALGFIVMMEIDNRLRRFNDVEGRSLMMWRFERGLWSWLPDRTVTKWMMPELQQILNYISHEKNSTIKTLNEAAQHVVRHEKVCIDSDAVFDMHGRVPTRDGLIDPITLQAEPLKPEHFATWVLPKVKYDPAAQCPHWIQMLNDALADKPEHEREIDIQLIQDFMGMSLLDAKPKALQRGLILLGTGDTGKSSLQQVMAGMLSEKWITTPLSALSGPHGTQAFIKRQPWVLGEAFTTSVWHLADTVKMILGGDSIEINPKNKDAICVKPNAPVIWATNFEPKFKEPTRAIVERIIVLKLTRVFDKSNPVGVAAVAKKINPAWWPHDLVLNTERAGLLNWMLVGAKRAQERGHFINTKAGEALLEDILDDSNVVRAFNKECTTPNPNTMISTPDYMQALVHWWQEHHGDEARPPNATMVGLHLKALADPRVIQDKDLFRDKAGLRFYLGIELNKAGLDHWAMADLANNLPGRSSSSARTSTSETAVTRDIKDEWLNLPEVEAMQKAHGKRPKI